MTPGEAIEAGADYLVIGRPITAQKNPREALEKILQELKCTFAFAQLRATAILPHGEEADFATGEGSAHLFASLDVYHDVNSRSAAHEHGDR